MVNSGMAEAAAPANFHGSPRHHHFSIWHLLPRYGIFCRAWRTHLLADFLEMRVTLDKKTKPD